MGVKPQYDRVGNAVYRSPRWKAVRLEAKRRDKWQCQECGARQRLEVHHLEPIRKAPKRAYDLTNLLTLCGSCHARHTAQELGHGQDNPARAAWRSLLRIPLDFPQQTRK